MRIKWEARTRVSDDVVRANRTFSQGLGLPEVGEAGPALTALAVVGGSPSVSGFLDEIGEWDGEIWAINGVWTWLRDNGVPATLYRIDPAEPRDGEAYAGCDKAILADIVAPSVFRAVKHAEIVCIDAIPHGTTAASTAPVIAAYRGHTSVTLFGCESSFDGGTHVYKNDRALSSVLRVECGGDYFLTSPQMIMQAEYIADLARQLPDYIRMRGGGFLPALIGHGDYEITHVSRDLHERLSA